MKPESSIIKQKQPAESKSITRLSKGLIQKETGGGLGTLFIGISIMLVVVMIFINVADYSVYTYKRNQLSKALDYAVTAAAQQINQPDSSEGIANGFSASAGTKQLEGIELDTASASKVLLSIFHENCSRDVLDVSGKLLLCSTSRIHGKLKYSIMANNKPISQGQLDSPEPLESELNNALQTCWPNAADPVQVYVNGNPKTNLFENGTALIAVISNVEVSGVYTVRKVNLTSFAGAKIIRKN